MFDFRWNRWNVEHIGDHGVTAEDAEYVVQNAKPPWPEYIGDGKWRVLGRTVDGTYLQVIYIYSPKDVVFVIHAMPMSENMKRQYRKRIR
jgi:hypothetical protein